MSQVILFCYIFFFLVIFLVFRSKIGDQSVTVAVTPNGYADAVYQDKFVMPEERTMKFNSFLDIIEKKVQPPGIFYVQKQNSNFTDEFRDLMADAAEEIPWATEAFGNYVAQDRWGPKQS